MVRVILALIVVAFGLALGWPRPAAASRDGLLAAASAMGQGQARLVAAAPVIAAAHAPGSQRHDRSCPGTPAACCGAACAGAPLGMVAVAGADATPTLARGTFLAPARVPAVLRPGEQPPLPPPRRRS